MVNIKAKSIYSIIITVIIISIVGCNKTSNKSTKSGDDTIAEAQVVKEDVTNDSKNDEVVTTVEPGGKVNITDTIKNEVLALAPGLVDYKTGGKITDEIKFKFIYYGYVYSDLSGYATQNKTMDGKNTTWVVIPKQDVDAKFKNTYGLDMGEYNPVLSNSDPMLYFENNNYYVCTSSKEEGISYSLIGGGDSVVKVKESFEGDEQYNEISITLQTANNEKGYIVTQVTSLPK